MSGFKTIVLAFASTGKTRNAAVSTKRVKRVVPSGNQFMYIGLVSDIKNQLILRCVKHAVQRQSNLDHPEIGCEMPTVV